MINSYYYLSLSERTKKGVISNVKNVELNKKATVPSEMEPECRIKGSINI